MNESCLFFEDYLYHARTPPDVTSFSSVRAAMIAGATLLFVLGVGTNGVLLGFIFGFEELRTTRNLYIANLAVANVAFCALSLPFTVYTYLYKAWPFDQFLCQFIPVLQGTPLCVSIFTLTAIAIDRFALIIWRYNIKFNATAFICGTFWLVGIAFSLPVALNMGIAPGSLYPANFCENFCQEIGWLKSSHMQAYSIALQISQYFLPLAVIGYCYVAVVAKVNSRIKFMTELESVGSVRRRLNSTLRKSQKTNRLLIAMIATFGTCWLPYVLLNLLRDLSVMGNLTILSQQHYLVFLVAYDLSMTSTVINPVLYGFLNTSFRAVLKRACRRTHRENIIPKIIVNEEDAPAMQLLGLGAIARRFSNRSSYLPAADLR